MVIGAAAAVVKAATGASQQNGPSIADGNCAADIDAIFTAAAAEGTRENIDLVCRRCPQSTARDIEAKVAASAGAAEDI